MNSRNNNKRFKYLGKSENHLDYKHIAEIKRLNSLNYYENQLKYEAELDRQSKLDNQFRETRSNRDPVVFVPGLLSTKLDISSVDWSKFPECPFYEQVEGTMWCSLNPPPGGTCQASLLKVGLDEKNGEYGSNSAYKVNIAGELGSIQSCRCLNDNLNCFAGNFAVGKNLFDALISVGYKDRVDLFAAGYDFRIVPYGNAFVFSLYNHPNNYIGQFFLRLKKIIEMAYTNNGNKKVHLIGHSEGCKMISLFINIFRRFEKSGDIENGWVDKHLNRLMLIAPGTEGAPKILRSLLSGSNPGLPLGTDSLFANLTRTFASSVFLIPLFNQRYYKFGNTRGEFAIMPDEAFFVGFPNEVGPNSNMVRFLKRCAEYNDEFNLVLSLYLNTLEINLESHYDPGLKTQLYLGEGCYTELCFKYTNYEFKEPTEFFTTLNGDGTVPTPVIMFTGTEFKYNGENRVIHPWRDVNVNMYKSTNPNSDLHLALIKDKRVIDSIIDIVSR